MIRVGFIPLYDTKKGGCTYMLPSITKEQRSQDLQTCNNALKRCEWYFENRTPDSQEFRAAAEVYTILLDDREKIQSAGKLTGDQKVAIAKVAAMAAVAIGVATISYWMPQAEKTLKYINVIPR